MHHVSKIDHASAQTPDGYQSHSTGFRRATYADRAAGSVHMGTGICLLLRPAQLIRTSTPSRRRSTFWRAASSCRSATRRTCSSPVTSA
ncbi:MAG: hypothetical protein U0703_14925 [Anaerolineae bacterium]